MNKRILGGLAAAAMLAGGLALTSAGVTAADAGPDIVVDSVHYAPTKAPNEGVYHFSLPGVTNPMSASVPDRGQTWNGVNGADNLPCENGTYWVSNNSKLVISHCIGEQAPEPAEVTPEFTPPTCDVPGAPVLTDEITWSQDGAFWYASSADPELFTLVGETVFDSTTLDEEDCPPPADKPSVVEKDIGKPVCGAMTIKVTVTTITYTPEYTEEGWIQVASEPVVTEDVRNLLDTEKFACPLVEVIPPAEVVAAFSPAQAPAVAPAQAVLPTQALPSTGIDSTGVTALIALLLTSLGGAALFLSRRDNVTN